MLEVLKKHHGTLSAADIHSKLPEIDLVTIYRNLDLFVKEKMIKLIFSKNKLTFKIFKQFAYFNRSFQFFFIIFHFFF